MENSTIARDFIEAKSALYIYSCTPDGLQEGLERYADPTEDEVRQFTQAAAKCGNHANYIKEGKLIFSF